MKTIDATEAVKQLAIKRFPARLHDGIKTRAVYHRRSATDELISIVEEVLEKEGLIEKREVR